MQVEVRAERNLGHPFQSFNQIERDGLGEVVWGERGFGTEKDLRVMQELGEDKEF